MQLNNTESSNLISAQQLSKKIDDNSVKLLVTNINFPISNEHVVATRAYIPGSQYFDLERLFVDQKSDLPHMLPDFQTFCSQLASQGIESNQQVVVYDNQGMFSSPRVWWMLKTIGHQSVQVLNGGLKAWVQSNGSLVEDFAPPISIRLFLNKTLKSRIANENR